VVDAFAGFYTDDDDGLARVVFDELIRKEIDPGSNAF
jgi:hypothetical protein